MIQLHKNLTRAPLSEELSWTAKDVQIASPHYSTERVIFAEVMLAVSSEEPVLYCVYILVVMVPVDAEEMNYHIGW